jgi:hypothetical protein
MAAQSYVFVAGLVMVIGLAGCLGGAKTGQSSRHSAEDGMTDVVVSLRPETARAFHGNVKDPGAGRLNAILSQFHAELRPQHPGTSDPELQSYFTISGLSPAQADSITAALRALEVVRAAYVQPAPSPP